MDSPESDSRTPKKRRPRYRGTHPRRFEQRYKELDPQRFPEMQAHVRAQGRTPAGTHVPILLSELLAALAPQAGQTVVDCTLGYGGHAAAFLERIGPTGKLIGLDLDGPELERTRRRFAASGLGFEAVRSNFAGLPRVLARLGLDGCDVIYADLGVSSMQIDDPERGFSYKQDGPLDMRMDDRIRRTAANWLNTLSESELVGALRDFGDEPHAQDVAREIIRYRSVRLLARTGHLADIVRRSARNDPGAIARVFQALRILVNDELAALRALLRVAPDCLRGGGRMGIITFHSGEDRLVKHAFRDGLRGGTYDAISEEPIRPGEIERRANPRSASARLRWAQRASGVSDARSTER
jgi:16S rRNA (cytosine1402-N4)-methyltransferase